MVDYLTSPLEMVARSYAQYIVIKSHNETLLAQLDNILNDESDYNLTQWTSANFKSYNVCIR